MSWLKQLYQAISPYMGDYGVAISSSLLFLFVGWWVGQQRAKGQWRRRQFYNRLNVSLNLIKNGRLMIRTIMENSLKEVFINKAAANLVVKSAKKATPEDPIIPLPEQDRWFVHNEILNQISEHFSAGLIRYDLGFSVKGAVYIIALTCEKAGEVRTHKIRAMLIRKEDLLNLPAEMPKLEHSSHETRFHTLQVLAQRFRENPDDFIQMVIYQ